MTTPKLLEEVPARELGKRIAELRDGARFTQADLARKVTWSPAVLSRVESGERELGTDELEAVLEAIGTSEAEQLRKTLARNWQALPRPPLDHRDEELLWAAETVAVELAELRERPDVKHAFERRLSEYIGALQRSASMLLRREHQIAFVGSIGIGKSTAICRITGLEVPSDEGGIPTPVLEAGAGGITICEVHLRTGPTFGVIVEPRNDEEVRADVTDFAEHILNRSIADPEDGDRDPESQGISKEIERAIRNMAKLRVRRHKGVDGKVIRRDEAKELAENYTNVRELVVAILARMELPRRDRRDLWYEASQGKPPLAWLKDTFEEINNGRHREFGLPRRVEIVVAERLLAPRGGSTSKEGGDIKDLTIRMIDTKGIDRTAARADLEAYLDDPHTVSVLCSGFNNAPAAEARLLLERACEASVSSIPNRAALLVLPRPNEALAVKDESGIRVDKAEEGYELKEEQILLSLQPLGLKNLAVGFFNALQDDPKRLVEFLVERISSTRQSFRADLHEITNNARTLLLNYEKEQVQEVLRHASAMIRSWTEQQRALGALPAHVQDSLMSQIAKAHPSTIRASVRREGEWPNLSYSHHLGFGARSIAARTLGSVVDGFSGLCATMNGNSEFSDASELINQANRVLTVAFEELLRKMQLMGQGIFKDALKSDGVFWLACDSEWGRGPGYRNRITSHNEGWFSADARKELEEAIRDLIDKEWRAALDQLNALLTTD